MDGRSQSVARERLIFFQETNVEEEMLRGGEARRPETEELAGMVYCV